jgi:hypothetical protein
MPTASITYLGDLRTQDTHLQSGTVIYTDAPTDNQGRGEAFSPTDLVANALGTCILTTIAILARRDGIELGESSPDRRRHDPLRPNCRWLAANRRPKNEAGTYRPHLPRRDQPTP